jgi:surface carbohydrate biosynthesis protein
MRFSEEAFRQVEVFFAWGDAQLEAIAAHRPETRARIRVTGNPRFDLLRPEWRPYFAAAADELRKAHGKFILVNTNFAFANHFNGEEGVRRLWASYSISREPGFYEGWADMNRRNLESFSRMLPRLRSEFPDHKIVIRPHPSENFDTWRAISAGMPSVLVSGEGSAVNWIIASELLVHSNCTTAIEAFLLEKPAIAYRACSPDRYDQPLPNALSIQVFDEDSLFRSAREWIGRPWTVGQSPADAERTAVAARHIASRSGPTAAERIAAALASLPRTEGTVPRHGSQPVSFPRRIWRMWLRFFRSRYRHNSAYASHKFPGLSTDEVRAGIAGFSAISPGFRHIRAEQVAPSVFRIVDDHDRTETADARPHGIRPAGVSSMTRAEGV